MGTGLRAASIAMALSGLAYLGGQNSGLLGSEAPRDDAPSLDHCDYTVDRESRISAAGVSLVDIRAGAGDLYVEGEEGRRDIEVVGRVCASDESFLEELTVTAETVGGTAIIQTDYPDHRDRGWNGGRTASIDLVVLVPAEMAVDVDDSSGDIEIRGTGTLRIDDSSGSVSVAGIMGSVEIDDSSGGLEIEDIDGDVRVSDSSGGIDILDVVGSVLIVEDGSGSIDVRNVGRDFEVRRDGSGGIRHSGVQGTVEIPRKRRRGG